PPQAPFHEFRVMNGTVRFAPGLSRIPRTRKSIDPIASFLRKLGRKAKPCSAEAASTRLPAS
ncbi:MAG TPA: hypothetical protein VJ857_02660, partial [Methanocorpusculum sp.]|nr:hypothetical protein [Methanocorpusculum sp.]